MSPVSITPSALSLSKGRSSFWNCGEQSGQGFDKLSLNGLGEAR